MPSYSHQEAPATLPLILFSRIPTLTKAGPNRIREVCRHIAFHITRFWARWRYERIAQQLQHTNVTDTSKDRLTQTEDFRSRQKHLLMSSCCCAISAKKDHSLLFLDQSNNT